jgi:hypothetical protein
VVLFLAFGGSGGLEAREDEHAGGVSAGADDPQAPWRQRGEVEDGEDVGTVGLRCAGLKGESEGIMEGKRAKGRAYIATRMTSTIAKREGSTMAMEVLVLVLSWVVELVSLMLDVYQRRPTMNLISIEVPRS